MGPNISLTSMKKKNKQVFGVFVPLAGLGVIEAVLQYAGTTEEASDWQSHSSE